MQQISCLIARLLSERNVERVFSLCGGHILPLWDALHRLGIRVIDVGDKRGAGRSLQKFLDAFRCVYLDTPESRGLIADENPRFMPVMRGHAMREKE